MLVLDGFQAGLSLIIILRKRDNFRRAFSTGFEPRKSRATRRRKSNNCFRMKALCAIA